MKFDLHNDSLFTDSGEFIKKLHCPLVKSWDEMHPGQGNSRTCDACSCEVYDTSQFSDRELLLLMSRNPNACLMVSPTQENLTVVNFMQNQTLRSD